MGGQNYELICYLHMMTYGKRLSVLTICDTWATVTTRDTSSLGAISCNDCVRTSVRIIRIQKKLVTYQLCRRFSFSGVSREHCARGKL